MARNVRDGIREDDNSPSLEDQHSRGKNTHTHKSGKQNGCVGGDDAGDDDVVLCEW